MAEISFVELKSSKHMHLFDTEVKDSIITFLGCSREERVKAGVRLYLLTTAVGLLNTRTSSFLGQLVFPCKAASLACAVRAVILVSQPFDDRQNHRTL